MTCSRPGVMVQYMVWVGPRHGILNFIKSVINVTLASRADGYHFGECGSLCTCIFQFPFIEMKAKQINSKEGLA